jgi:SAM-dependent methyltransferase
LLFAERTHKMINNKRTKIKSILSIKPIEENCGRFSFFDDDMKLQFSAGKSFIGRLQSFLKKFEIYSKLVSIFGPVTSSNRFKYLQKKILNKYTENNIILSIGSGGKVYEGRKDILNCDLFAFNNVDIVCDASSLPIKDNSVDYIINIAMLEHIKNPKRIIDEMLRCCKKNAEVLCSVPFIVPYHAAPDDYYRWTKNGAEELFKDFSRVEVGIGAGPTSGMLWIFQEWLSLVLSFGNSTIKDVIFLILMIVTFPIKYLDIVFEKFPNAEKLASGFYIYAKK